MPRSRAQVRDFPGRRALNLTLRTAHIAGVVLLGAALLGAGTPAAGLWLTLLSGLGMFAGDLWANPAHLREMAGFAIIAKLAMLGLIASLPGLAMPLFWAILAISVLLSHAPAAVRHRRLF
ncbi:MAG: hypothetical protein FIB06_11675 [Betaproteobacteria bacterium]|nr:hypothetical protein [Betaproteobacteria bacterium]